MVVWHLPAEACPRRSNTAPQTRAWRIGFRAYSEVSRVCLRTLMRACDCLETRTISTPDIEKQRVRFSVSWSAVSDLGEKSFRWQKPRRFGRLLSIQLFVEDAWFTCAGPKVKIAWKVRKESFTDKSWIWKRRYVFVLSPLFIKLYKFKTVFQPV